MAYPSNTVKVKKVDEEKGTVLVCFANTFVNRKMRLVSVDLFGGLRLKHFDKLNQNTYIIPKYEVGKWVEYSVEEPEEISYSTIEGNNMPPIRFEYIVKIDDQELIKTDDYNEAVSLFNTVKEKSLTVQKIQVILVTDTRHGAHKEVVMEEDLCK